MLTSLGEMLGVSYLRVVDPLRHAAAWSESESENMGENVTLGKDVPEPEKWFPTGKGGYYYKHKESGRQILESQYYAKVKARNTLAEYIEEVDEYDEKIPPEYR